jgi:hypothetical protein
VGLETAMSTPGMAMLESVLADAKWRHQASNKLVRVRSVTESDMDTLERVIEDHQRMNEILYRYANHEQRRQLEERMRGLMPIVLRDILESLDGRPGHGGTTG